MERINYNYNQRRPPALPARRTIVYKKKPAPRIRWGRLLTVVFFSLFFLSAMFGFFTSLFLGRFSLMEEIMVLMPSSGFIGETNILVLGIDATAGVQRSDTIMAVHIDSKQKKVGVVSIPRDTLVVIPRFGLDKINHAYARGGVELARETASNFLGAPIPYHVKINVGGLENIIDKLDGITIDVEKRMYYVDLAQNLFVDLKPGMQRLSGKEALGYVRFRHDQWGDIGRINRQQNFLRAILAELFSGRNILKTPGILKEFLANVETNLTSKEILGLALEIRGAYDSGGIEMTALPGAGDTIDGVYYFRANQEATQRIIEKMLRGKPVGNRGLSGVS